MKIILHIFIMEYANSSVDAINKLFADKVRIEVNYRGIILKKEITWVKRRD